MRLARVLVVLASACSSNAVSQDSGHQAAVCQGVAYDPCNDATGCPQLDNAVCEPIDGDPSQVKVCTVACTGSGTCPANGVGNVGICMNGYCFADRGDCTPR